MNKVTGGNVLIDPQIVIKKAQISKRMKVADLGCGVTGHFTFPIAQVVGDHGVIYAVDILRNILANIEHRARQENLIQLKTVWTNLEIFKATKIASASLDIGLLINILYLSDKRAEVIRESIRMIKKGGKLLVIDWNKADSPLGPSLEERVDKDNIIAICKRLGMELTEEFEAGDYHLGLVFIKH